MELWFRKHRNLWLQTMMISLLHLKETMLDQKLRWAELEKRKRRELIHLELQRKQLKLILKRSEPLHLSKMIQDQWAVLMMLTLSS